MLNNKIKTVIKFGGFYESIHYDLIDMQIENHIECINQENNTSLDYDDYDFNYKDEIDCYILKSDENKLIKHFKKDNDFLEYLKDSCKSRDGFISYYKYDSAIMNQDNILTLYIFEYIANKYQESDSFNTDIYIDISENQPELV